MIAGQGGVAAEPNIRCCAVEHTERLILRPSVTSSGKIRRKSSRQSPPSLLLPTAEPTELSTSFHAVFSMANLARHTQSCVRIGRGPARYNCRRDRSESRKGVRASGGNWWRSWVIWHSESALESSNRAKEPDLPLQSHGCEQPCLHGRR